MAAGFTSGNSFSAVTLSGHVTITCDDTLLRKTESFNCRDVVLKPVEYDTFSAEVADANQITLVITRQDGTVRTKTLEYDGRKGKSSQRFNLWVSALFQTPMLAEGNNNVEYRLTKGNQVVNSGKVPVLVARGAPIQCKEGTLESNVMSDCESMYSTCQKYFSSGQFCQ